MIIGGGDFLRFGWMAGVEFCDFEIAIVGGGSGIGSGAGGMACTAGTFGDFFDLKPLACSL